MFYCFHYIKGYLSISTNFSVFYNKFAKWIVVLTLWSDSFVHLCWKITFWIIRCSVRLINENVWNFLQGFRGCFICLKCLFDGNFVNCCPLFRHSIWNVLTMFNFQGTLTASGQMATSTQTLTLTLGLSISRLLKTELHGAFQF